MQFHKRPQFDAPSHGHHHVVHQMPTYNFYHNQYPWFRYPSGNSVYYTMYGNTPIEYVPTSVRAYSTREMDILSRVYLGGLGLVGLLILYNLMDKK